MNDGTFQILLKRLKKFHGWLDGLRSVELTNIICEKRPLSHAIIEKINVYAVRNSKYCSRELRDSLKVLENEG